MGPTKQTNKIKSKINKDWLTLVEKKRNLNINLNFFFENVEDVFFENADSISRLQNIGYHFQKLKCIFIFAI